MSAEKKTAPAAAPAKDPLADELAHFEFAELSQKTAKRPVVLFFGRPTFSDNTKYLYLAALRAAKNFEVVWCGYAKPLLAELRARGLPCFDLTTDFRTSCTLLLEAAVAVFCENPESALAGSSAFSGCLAGAQKIQLWHGVSVKPLDLMLLRHLNVGDQRWRRQLRFATRIDHSLSTAAALDGFWIRAHGAAGLIRAGQPRNEVIVRAPTELEMIGAQLPAAQADGLRSAGKRKLLVAPTWPRGTPNFVSTPAFHERLHRWAAANDALVWVKSHPFLQRVPRPADSSDRVQFLDAGTDVYPWLAHFDALITDYSSIMFDYLLTNRPVFTFNVRTQAAFGFEPDYSFVPEGRFRYDFDAESFERVLEENLADHPLAAEQRRFTAQIFETAPQDACAQLLPVLANLCGQVVDKSFTVTNPRLPAPLAVAV